MKSSFFQHWCRVQQKLFAKWTIKIKKYIMPLYISGNADEEESQHPLISYCKPSSVEKKGRRKKKRGRKKLRRGKKNRGRKGEKTDGDRWGKRQVRKDRREEGVERRRRRDRGID